MALPLQSPADPAPAGAGAPGAAAAPTGPEPRYFIREYRVKGAKSLPRIDVESAVYPYLGPDRPAGDIERARAALEKAYSDAGLQTVGVTIPAQNVLSGIVVLQVLERKVGRLRVKGAKYSSPQKIRDQAPSVAEGKVINFNEVPKDIAGLNQLPDRQVSPSLHAGVAPDTVDVDLEVKESSPLHASVEVNNRRGPSTKPLRVNASVSANNLGQTGQSLGFSFQTAPQETSQVKVFSGYTITRFHGAEWLNVMLQGTKQDSNVSTLGDSAVAGRGTTAGLRLLFNLPPVDSYTQSASVGIDYKHFDQSVSIAATSSASATTAVTPITYYPLTAGYSGTWTGKNATTDFNAGVTFHLRGIGSDLTQFNNNRYNAGSDFLYFHGDLSRTQELWWGFQLYGKVQGQIADQPLLSGEQISGGGLGTVRGYRESEAVGDSGVFGTAELRSPQLLHTIRGAKADWRLYGFLDGGWLRVTDALTGQKNHFDLASYGVGTRFQLTDHFSGTVNAAKPLFKVGETKPEDLRVIFQGTLEY